MSCNLLICQSSEPSYPFPNLFIFFGQPVVSCFFFSTEIFCTGKMDKQYDSLCENLQKKVNLFYEPPVLKQLIYSNENSLNNLLYICELSKNTLVFFCNVFLKLIQLTRGTCVLLKQNLPLWSKTSFDLVSRITSNKVR